MGKLHTIGKQLYKVLRKVVDVIGYIIAFVGMYLLRIGVLLIDGLTLEAIRFKHNKK